VTASQANAFIGVDEVAALLNVPKSWVYRQSGRDATDPLPVLRLGGYLRYERSAILKWARDHANATDTWVPDFDRKGA
jgi:predicted DNA-binding transcriptional regulator AlpA